MKSSHKTLVLLTVLGCTACAANPSPKPSPQIEQICEEAEAIICDYWNQLSTVNDSEIFVDSIEEDGDLVTMEFSVTLNRTYTTPPEEMPDI